MLSAATLRAASAPAAALWFAARGAPARFGGEPGRRLAADTPDATHRLPGEIEAKLRGWAIHASQREVVRKLYRVPARALYWLWDEERYRVEELRR